MENLNDWIKAGKIAAEALNYSKSLIKEGESLLFVCNEIEKKVIDLGGRPTFPVNISINSVAAHYTSSSDDKSAFKNEDMVKIDVGVEVNGFVGDNALTIYLGKEKKYLDLVNASKGALDTAVKLVKPGVKLCEIGIAIHKEIQKYGFSPIKNLSGHGIERYNIHSGINVPNYDNGDKRELKEGQIIAIEPFATDGKGYVIEGKQSGIYKLVNKKPIRDNNSRKVLEFIEKNYKTLPFAKRWIKTPMANIALNILEREGIISQYPQLVEENKGFVSQAEHTILVKDLPIILTKI